MSSNEPASPTSSGPKAKARPYVLLANLRPGRAGSCLTWAGGCGAPAPAPPKILAPAEPAIRARRGDAMLDDAAA